jgi:phosphoserine phosphatase RsbU/P
MNGRRGRIEGRGLIQHRWSFLGTIQVPPTFIKISRIFRYQIPLVELAMTTTDPDQKPDPKLRQTLKQDIKSRDLWSTIRRDYRELEKFYIDDEKKQRLGQMKWFKRGFFLSWWLIKSMLLKLTPARRILLFIGFFLILGGGGIIIQGDHVRTGNWEVFGSVLLLFVLMLELKDKLLARDELEAGRKVQHALMPERSPFVPGWSLWLFTRPANEVGGDLVDFLNFNDNRKGVILADVSGKGLQAALLTAKLQATVRALGEDYESIALLTSKINAIFHRDSLPNMFASLLYIELSPDSGHIKFVNAGHLPPVLLTAGGMRETTKGEQALGLIGSSSYTEQVADLDRGDVYLGYSDGVTEARNELGEFFGQERLQRLLPSLRNLGVSEIGQMITSEVDRFVGEARANDDISLVIVKRM